ncbi:hypothetical protein [Crinalium epipsammum]|uniref:hypothetical protein n=1 Tax=Crinalium epipsammum TaxID=241425 RepID=UPI0002FC9DC4|nr:hypothetical protein [Crinalium epipsammum]
MADSKRKIARKTLSTKRSSKQNDIDAEVQAEVLIENQRPKNRIHFVDGEKGGVGKSLFCRVLIEYCKSKGLSDRIHFVESDLSNPDVGKIYFDRDTDLPNYHEV